MPHPLDDRPSAASPRPVVVKLSPSPQELHSLDPKLDLDVFPSEALPATSAPARSRAVARPPAGPDKRRTPLAPPAVMVTIVATAAGAVAWLVAANGGLPGVSSGRVRIESAPPGAPVFVDAIYQGNTPLVASLSLGNHHVSVGGGETISDAFQVDVRRGMQVYRVQLAAAVAPAEGPGATDAKKPTPPAPAPRVVEPVRAATVAPQPRRPAPKAPVTRTTVAPPSVTAEPVRGFGLLDINAQPWALVSIDGVAVGETPLGELRLSAGVHEVTFTHPELGQRRNRVTVNTGERTRLAVDMRAK